MWKWVSEAYKFACVPKAVRETRKLYLLTH